MEDSRIKHNPAPKDREVYIRTKEKDALSLLKSTQEKIPYLFDPAKYEMFLGLFNRFHRYSYINVILIFTQHTKATYLAGFDTWQTLCLNTWHNPNRQILKNDQKGKGIRLLAPYTYARSMQDRELMNFVVSVYDISQTNSLPPLEQVPEYILHPKTRNLISAVRHRSPYRIILAGRENTILQNGLHGYCDHMNQLIILNENLKGTKLLDAMLREVIAAEAELLWSGNDEYTDLIIESVFFILNQHFGNCVVPTNSDLLFVSRYKAKPLSELSSALYTIQRVSHKLIDSLEMFLDELEEYDSSAWVNEELLLDFEMETIN